MKKFLRGLPACALVSLAMPVWAEEAPNQYTLDIEQQPIVAALTEFSRQTGLQVGYLPESPEEENAIVAPLKGQYTAESALKEMLKPSGLGFERVNERTVSVGAVEDARARRNRLLRLDRSGDVPADAPRWRVASLMSGDAGSMEEPRSGEVNGPAKVGDDSQKLSKGRRSSEVEEVIVTGSRIPVAAEGAQAVRVYGREDIERSGQTTVAGFLNVLPSVSVEHPESTWVGFAGQTTVRMRGLPVGTTLVLLNGQRVEASGTFSFENVFDLNSIPVSAVERIEVLSSGTSIYGSDAIAGVVNIILKRNLEGLHMSAGYGGASGITEANGSIAWGHRWQRGGLSLIGTYQDRGELRGTERELTASNDYRRFGGPDNNRPTCRPGNVFFPDGFSFDGSPPVQFAAVPPGLIGQPSVSDFASTAGTLNTCGLVSSAVTIIPATERTGLVVSGDYELAPAVSIFSDLLFSRNRQQSLVLGSPQIGNEFTVPTSNPYNPFGTTVSVAYRFAEYEYVSDFDTDFGRALIGARGTFGESWVWEVSSLRTQDLTHISQRGSDVDYGAVQAALNSSDPATAINPFIDGPAGSAELLGTFFDTSRVDEMEGRRQTLSGFVRGSVLELPAGDVELALGSEYARDRSSQKTVTGQPEISRTDTRSTTAFYGEARIPVLSAREDRGDALTLTLAARYDDYSDFGSTINPQFAAEWRPLETLLLRGNYAESFRAPSLRTINQPSLLLPRNLIVDPTTGQQVEVSVQTGGNPGLRPEVGQSQTFGVVYWSKGIPDLRLSLTHWKVEQTDTIQGLSSQTVVNNESSFPGRVVRDQAGVIRSVDTTTVNFGGIDAVGLDYDVNYQKATSIGTWSGSISATQIYGYDVQITPGAPVRDRVGKADFSGNWAPRWKGTATAGWQRGSFSMNFMGRYVSRYQDYVSTREIGNFWLYDAHFRYEHDRVSGGSLLKGFHLEFGAVNVFDTLPQYSTYDSFLGYDPAQGDIRGRYLYLQLGARL